MLTDTLYNRTTTIQTYDGRRIMVLPSGEIIDIGDEKFSSVSSTKNDSSDAEKILDAAPTVFNSEQLRTLEKLKNEIP